MHEALAESLYVEVRVDDGEVGYFFQEKQVGQAIIELVVAQRYHVGSQVVHDLHGRDALVLRVDERAL